MGGTWEMAVLSGEPIMREQTTSLGSYRHWQVSSRHHQSRTLDYGYLLGLLEDMQAHWEEAASLPQEQVGMDTATGLCAAGKGLPRSQGTETCPHRVWKHETHGEGGSVVRR